MERPGQVKPEPVSDTGLGHEKVLSGTKGTYITVHQQEEDPYSTVKHEPLDPVPHTQESNEVSCRDAVSTVSQSECWQGHTNSVVAEFQLAEVLQSNNIARVLEKKRRVRSAVPFLPDPLKVCAEEQREVLLPSSSEDEAEDDDDAVEVVGSVQVSHGPPYILPDDAVDQEGNTSLQSPAKILSTVVNTKNLLLDLVAQHKFPVPLARIAPRPSPPLQNGLADNMKHSGSRNKCEEPSQILPDVLHKTSGIVVESQQCLLEEQPSAHDSWTATGCRRGLRVDANGFPVKKNGSMYKTKGYIYEKARAYYERRMATETIEEKALRLEKARQRLVLSLITFHNKITHRRDTMIDPVGVESRARRHVVLDCVRRASAPQAQIRRYYRKKEEKGSPLHTLHESTGDWWSRQHRAHSVRTCSSRDPQGSEDLPTAQMLIASSALQAGQRPLLPRPPPSSLDCGGVEGGAFPSAELMARLQQLRALLLQAGHPLPPTDGDTGIEASVVSEAGQTKDG